MLASFLDCEHKRKLKNILCFKSVLFALLQHCFNLERCVFVYPKLSKFHRLFFKSCNEKRNALKRFKGAFYVLSVYLTIFVFTSF